jgi:hypothetical protein
MLSFAIYHLVMKERQTNRIVFLSWQWLRREREAGREKAKHDRDTLTNMTGFCIFSGHGKRARQTWQGYLSGYG